MTEAQVRFIGRAFSDAIHDAQASFRMLLNALSEPGIIHIFGASLEAPPALHQASAIGLLTLADQDTSVWLSPSFGSQVADYLRFHCGAPITAVAAEASFAVLAASDHVDLAAFNPGDDCYPDQSATVIVQCAELAGASPVGISGPGIRGIRTIAPAVPSKMFWQQVSENHARYPLGVDLLLTSETAVLALPRSTSITMLEDQL